MTTDNRCPHCKRFVISGWKHFCPPKFWIVSAAKDETPEVPEFRHASDAEAALLDWVQQLDSDTDYGIVNDGEEPEFWVLSDEVYQNAFLEQDIEKPEDVDWREVGSEYGQKFKVTGEYVPSYWAVEV